jgi:uncharacterized membrane protein YkvA (DUF1232 family)
MEPEREIEQAATELLQRKFLPEAERPGTSERIDAELGPKIEKVRARRIRYRTQLLEVVRQANALWKRRSELDRKQVALLGAALLYFVSPMDFLPDVLPGLGYVDDLAVVAYVLKTLSSSLRPLRDALIDRTTSSVVDKGRRVLEEVIDTRLAELDRASAQAVRRSVAIVAISLWGTTTAAAISLAIVALTGKYALEWTIYVAVSSALVGFWNITIALSYWREFRRLHGDTQTRLTTLVASKMRKRDLLAIAAPIVLLIALLAARLVLV